jgi:tetratricopeptide (TPR) repeat protein
MTRWLCVCLLALAPAAAAQVKAYEEDLVIPTWEIGPPQVHSIFRDAGGEIYPYTLNETLTNNKRDKTYKAVWLENEYIRVLVLPEIGGRLHGALDKTNGYTWLYWQKTIKPGLISMTGAWISGGIEWNFPHGHRPSGFMPVERRIVKNADGSATVWVGETEPIFRMRWLVGMTIFPGRSYIRCDYIFINPTPLKHSFQFWATAATHANEYAQAQYPGDMVTGHGKHEFWNWPIHEGVDLTWWKNVPNASSFFAFNNPSDWFGAYDHKAQGGTVHVANHWLVQGKKLWTWGAGPSGRIWETILTEGGGPYFEPQAGVFSDNQPDYHWMMPYEVKRAHDYWYPVRDTRGFHNASRDFAINTDLRDGKAFAGVYSTAAVKGYKVVFKNAKTGAVLREAAADIAPDKPYTVEIPVSGDTTVYDLHLAVLNPRGGVEIEVRQQPPKKVDLPPGQQNPGDPKKMNSDELYHAGEWLDRYRRTEQALEYYNEALRRDPKDSRVNAEMGILALKQGRWKDALAHFETALLRDSDNPRLYYGKGLALEGMRQFNAAYDEHYRATHGRDAYAPAYFNLAKLDAAAGRWGEALEKVQLAARQNADFADLAAFEAAVLRKLEQHARALEAAGRAIELDPMNFMGGYEKLLALRNTRKPAEAWEAEWRGYMRGAAQNYMETSMAYFGAGMYGDADALMEMAAAGKPDSELNPMVNYFRGYFREVNGDAAGAAAFYARARRGPLKYVNPHRMEARSVLESAIKQDPSDAQAHHLLGLLLYATGQREEGFAHWTKAVEINPRLSLSWRNAAYAQRHLKKDLAKSHEAYRKAFEIDSSDARVLLEMDDAAEALKRPALERLALLEKHASTVETRDDLTARLADLRLERGTPADLKQAYDVLKNRHFRSWEGRYGIHHAWVEVNKRLGDRALEAKDYKTALSHYEQACEYPQNLEVAPRTPDFRAHVNWDLARVYAAMGQAAKAKEYYGKILAEKYGRPHLGLYYQALAQKAAGDDAAYRASLAKLEKAARDKAAGGFAQRGNPEVIGRYLLALVLEEKGDKAGAAAELKRALEMNPRARRLAVTEAQIDTARAHQ